MTVKTIYRQQAIILHRALSVKYALHQNVNSQFREGTYRDLQEKLDQKKKTERDLIFVLMAHVACQSFRERSLWMSSIHASVAWSDQLIPRFFRFFLGEGERVCISSAAIFAPITHAPGMDLCQKARESVYPNVNIGTVPRLPGPRLPPGGSLGTPKILGTGATFQLGPGATFTR